MNCFEKLWLRLTYKHPGLKVGALTGERRARAIALYRDSLQETRKKQQGKTFETLSLKQIAIGQEAVFANALELIKDAKRLRRVKSYARAYALAKLAQEEIGKIYLLDLAAMLAFVDAKNADWAPFWRAWRDHKTKSLFMKLPFAPHAINSERIDAEENAKLAALYVEIDHGEFTIPSLAATKEMTDNMLEICDRSVIHARAKFRDTPLFEKDGRPGPRIDGILATFMDANGFDDRANQ